MLWKESILRNCSKNGTSTNPPRALLVYDLVRIAIRLWLYLNFSVAAFGPTQKYCLVALCNSGIDLEALQFDSSRGWVQAAGIFWQVAAALASAEDWTKFEVRLLFRVDFLDWQLTKDYSIVISMRAKFSYHPYPNPLPLQNRKITCRQHTHLCKRPSLILVFHV